MQRVARSEEILQWGFDETSLDGTPTLNQWVLLQEGLGGSSVITIECCGPLVGSTAEEIADHVRASWLTGLTVTILAHNLVYHNLVPFQLGQQCIDMLREELGPMLADIHVPLVKGGVQLHKLQGVMHDTCNTANKTASLAKALRDTSGQLYYGYDNWELLAEDDKPLVRFLVR